MMKEQNDMRFGYTPVYSDITDRVIVNGVIARYDLSLGKIGGEMVQSDNYDQENPLIYFVVSGGTELKIIDLVYQRILEFNREPIFLIAYPENNSLPASLETLARMHQDRLKGEIIFLKGPDDQKGLDKIKTAIHDLKTYRKLFHSRIGLIGNPSEWLVASVFQNAELKKSWGINVINYSLLEVFKYILDQKPDDLKNLNVQNEFTGFDTLKDEFGKAYSVYEILDTLAKVENLDALSVECFTLFQSFNTHGCLALSRLNDSGTIAGCEGDLVSTLAMLWLKFRLGQNSWMANPVEIDFDAQLLWLAHCTVPVSMVVGFREDTHFETQCGVAIAGEFATGPVTIVRIGGATLDKIWIADAEIIDTGNSPHRCRTQVLLKFRDSQSLIELIKKPLGNHLVLTKGHHAQQLLQWWKMFISPLNF